MSAASRPVWPEADFPADSFASWADFVAHASQTAPAERHRPGAAYDGTCAPCLSTARFTDGVCDCEFRLGTEARAVLHFLQSRTRIGARSRVLALGEASPLHHRLATVTESVTRLRKQNGRLRLPARPHSVQAVVTLDAVVPLPAPERLFAQIRQVLAPGGQFVFAAPFDPDAPGARADQRFGWDLLGRLRDAGFRRALAHRYHSEELGYRTASAFLFAADS